jgi:hypothetical protein
VPEQSEYRGGGRGALGSSQKLHKSGNVCKMQSRRTRRKSDWTTSWQTANDDSGSGGRASQEHLADVPVGGDSEHRRRIGCETVVSILRAMNI